MPLKIARYRVKLSGLSGIMFDRFIDYSKEVRKVYQKLYVLDDKAIIPSDNIDAFLWGLDPRGCAMKYEGKPAKDYRSAGMSNVSITEPYVYFTDGKGRITVPDSLNITSGDIDDEHFWIHHGSPRMKKGSGSIKAEIKHRPVLRTPWFLEFEFTLVENTLIDATKMLNYFERGGVDITLGTYRPKFGRFEVVGFDEIK